MNTIIQMVAKKIATVGPIGYMPAPGTCASFFTVAVAYVLPHIPLLISMPLLIGISIVSAVIIAYALDAFQEADPRECVLDEVVGMAWVLIGIPKELWVYGLAFLLFRLFDITKWAGVHYVERLSSWRGVLLDDIAAAFWARFVMQISLYVLWYR